MKVTLTGAVVALSLALSLGCAKAGENGTDKLFSVESRATPNEVPAGAKGAVEIDIKLKKGAHISDEAPFKVTLSGKNVKLEKEALGRTDAVHKDDATSVRVPFVAEGQGAGGVEGDMVFFVCTEKLCERQQKKVSVPVTVK